MDAFLLIQRDKMAGKYIKNNLLMMLIAVHNPELSLQFKYLVCSDENNGIPSVEHRTKRTSRLSDRF